MCFAKFSLRFGSMVNKIKCVLLNLQNHNIKFTKLTFDAFAEQIDNVSLRFGSMVNKIKCVLLNLVCALARWSIK